MPDKELPSTSLCAARATWGSQHRLECVLKRALDVLGSVVFILLAAPIFVCVACAIVWDSGFPVLYRRRVLGIDSQFDAFKFRTMRVDADAVLAGDSALKAEFEKNFKLKDDPRVTRVGSFLRRKSLDELPQLFNVLAGQMSLVGPRMITAPELAKYGTHGALLRSVKPGLTGYWQVHGRQAVDYAERVRMDLRYIREWSLAMDLRILARTPHRVFRGDGAF